jgi:hypothetical protein
MSASSTSNGTVVPRLALTKAEAAEALDVVSTSSRTTSCASCASFAVDAGG